MPATIDLDKEAERKVSQASKSVDRAIGRLVQFLGDENKRVVGEALEALEALGGPAIVGPLAGGLARASTAIHRARIVAALLKHDEFGSPPAIRALLKALKKERDPSLSKVIRATLTMLILRGGRPRRTATSPATQGTAALALALPLVVDGPGC